MAITAFKEIFPVLPLEVRFLHVILVIYVFPVDTLTVRLSLQFTLATVILPVEVVNKIYRKTVNNLLLFLYPFAIIISKHIFFGSGKILPFLVSKIIR